jgi:hypothetical protein
MNGVTEAPVTEWVLGPYGELGIGPVQWPKLRSYLFRIWLPSLLLVLWTFSLASIVVSGCLIFILVRFSQLTGTDVLVHGARAHWGRVVAGASAALYALYFVHGPSAGSTFGWVYSGACVLTMIGTQILLGEGLLLSWEPDASAFPSPEVTLDELAAARDEFVAAADALLTLPLFDGQEPVLLQAWQARNPGHIAAILQEGNLLTQDAWKNATIFHNEAVALVDRGRRKLDRLVRLAQTRLDYFQIDTSAMEVERSKLAHLTLTRAVPRKLTSSEVCARQGAYLHGYAKVAVQGAMGSVSPVEALVGLGVVFALQLILTSRMLRRLKEVEGQLKVNAQTARGDLSIMSSLLTTRMIPQLEQMTVLIGRLEEGLLALPRTAEDRAIRDAGQIGDPTAKDRALQLAFAVIEGKKLVGMAAGD